MVPIPPALLTSKQRTPSGKPDGVLRGILSDGVTVHKGMKAGDVDPRCKVEYCYTASDKALSVGGGVLEAILYLQNQMKGN